MNYKIITDGSCDLSNEEVKESGVRVVPFYVSFDEKNYYKEKEDIDIRDFYQKMVDSPDIIPKSSLPSPQDYMAVFEEYAKENTNIICICITTKFSGSYNSACNAKEVIEEKYPDVKIAVIDAKVNTVLQGLLVLEAARMKKNGLNFEECVENIERIKETGRIIFTIGSMEYLEKGGRIGKLAGAFTSLLGIKPIIMLKEGEIFPIGVTRARKKSKKLVLEKTLAYFKDNNLDPNKYVFAIGYGYDYNEAVEFKAETVEFFKDIIDLSNIKLSQIGATIAVHTGPHPIGFGIIQRYDN